MLWLKGQNFDPEAVVASLALKPYKVWRQGEPLGRRQGATSGFSFMASEAGFDSFQQQVTDTIAFIQAHQADLRQLGDLALTLNEGEFYVDFGLYSRIDTVFRQVDVLPAELIRLCGAVRAGILFSQYPPSTDEGDDT